jgi:hypothetical protein
MAVCIDASGEAASERAQRFFKNFLLHRVPWESERTARSENRPAAGDT